VASYWEELHKRYDDFDWTEKPSIFAEEVIQYLPKHGTLLDIGAGQGQDSVYFAQAGFQVFSTDKEISIIERADQYSKDFFAKQNVSRPGMRFQIVDLQQRFPFYSDTFDVVYSHLALHYFSIDETEKLFAEIYRVLKPGGIVAFIVNSVNDPEFNTGKRLEEHYFDTEGTYKRYFDTADALAFTKSFEVILCDQKGETYKDQAKDVHNLIRYVGKKL